VSTDFHSAGVWQFTNDLELVELASKLPATAPKKAELTLPQGVPRGLLPMKKMGYRTLATTKYCALLAKHWKLAPVKVTS